MQLNIILNHILASFNKTKLFAFIKNKYLLIFILFSIIFYFPLFQISQFLPFAYWDAFTDQYAQLNGFATEWNYFIKNIIHAIFFDKVQFRPLSILIFNLQYLIFNGEFWAWYFLKWIMFSSCCILLYHILNRVTNNQLASIFGLSFFLFHPMPFVTDVMAQDGYVVFWGMLLLLLLIYWNKNDYFSVENLKNYQLIIIYVLFLAVAFSKEIGISIDLTLFLLFLIKYKNKWTFSFYIKLAIPFIILFFTSFRLLQVNHPSSQLHSILSQNYNFIKNILIGHKNLMKIILNAYSSLETQLKWKIILFFRYFFPGSPHDILKFLLIFIVITGLIISLIKKEKSYTPFFFFSLIGFLGSLIIISVVYPCPKYLPVPVFLFSIALGISSFILLKYLGSTITFIIASLIILTPIFTSGDIYAQWLGMMQSLYEESDIINFMENKYNEGYALTWTGIRNEKELPWEKGASIQEFFIKSSSKFYGYKKQMKFTILSINGIPKNKKFVMLSNISPNLVAAGVLHSIGINSLYGIIGIYQYQRERYGFFEKITGNLKLFEKFLGSQHAEPIDCASPHPTRFSPGMLNPDMSLTSYFSPTSGPHFLYVFNFEKDLKNSYQPLVKQISPMRRYGAFGR